MLLLVQLAHPYLYVHRFLAKTIFNTIDVNINAIVHFVLHFVIVNIGIAAANNLASEHPLFRPIKLVSQATSRSLSRTMCYMHLRKAVSSGGSFIAFCSLLCQSCVFIGCNFEHWDYQCRHRRSPSRKYWSF